MKRLVKFLLCFALLKPAVTLGAVDQELFRRALTHAGQLIRHQSPEHSFLLNLGRTMPPITAIFRILSGAKPSGPEWFREVPITEIVNLRRYSASQRSKIFDRIFPTDEVLQGRTLVIVRALWESMAMTEVIPFVIEYIKTYRPNLRFGVYFITSKGENDYLTVKRILETEKSAIASVEWQQDEYYVLNTRDTDHGTSVSDLTQWQPFIPQQVLEDDFKMEVNGDYRILDGLYRGLLRDGHQAELTTLEDFVASALARLRLKGMSHALDRCAEPPRS